MQFQVPQFIEVEDKLVGPFTFKQFIYLLGGGGGSYVVWRLISPLSSILAIIFVIPVAVTALALAFYKINNRPFIVTLEYGIKYLLTTKLYIWTKQEVKVDTKMMKPVEAKPIAVVPRLNESKLKDLAWSLDITEKMQQQKQQ